VGVLTLLILVNLFTGIIFAINEQGLYVEGPLFNLLYGYALICCIVGALWSLIQIKSLSFRRMIVVWEFILICAVSVLIQAIHHEILTTGFGICLGLTALYLYVNDPSNRIDRLTGAWDKQSLNLWLQEQMNYGRRLHLIAVELYQLKKINLLHGDPLGDQILTEVAKQMRRLAGGYLFRLGSGRFFLVVTDINAYHDFSQKLTDLFNEGFTVGKETIPCPAILCGIPDAQALRSPEDLLAYERHLCGKAVADGKTVFQRKIAGKYYGGIKLTD
jgi:GGDEF domain-containing protein